MSNNLEQHVTSLELSKKLKTLGVKQESINFWVDGELWDRTTQSDYEVPSTPTEDSWVSAFLFTELWDMLPEHIYGEYKSIVDFQGHYLVMYTHFREDDVNFSKGLANAAAEALIWCIESEYVDTKGGQQ